MNKTAIVAIVTLIIGVLIGYGISSDNRGYWYQDREEMHEEMEEMHEEMGEEFGMMGMGGHMMDMTVSSEKEFLEGMIPHHQEAVDTAKEVIARGGTTPEIKNLVENIVIAQEAEIANMKQWYQDWYGEAYVDTNQYQPMMRELANLSGAEIDRAFLADMIMHHMGAIMMAQSVQPYIEHTEIENLTAAIVTTQSQEIREMRLMLQNL